MGPASSTRDSRWADFDSGRCQRPGGARPVTRPMSPGGRALGVYGSGSPGRRPHRIAQSMLQGFKGTSI